MPTVHENANQAMTVSIEKPELQRYIREQVHAGRFASPEDLVAISLAQFIAGEERGHDDMENSEELTSEAVASILRANEQFERGQYLTSDEIREKLKVNPRRK
jgi:hypothetical protein